MSKPEEEKRPTVTETSLTQISRSWISSRTFTSIISKQPVTYWELLEEYKAPIKKKCRYGSKCREDICDYVHKREEYSGFDWVIRLRTLLKRNKFETLCRYNLGDHDNVKSMIERSHKKFGTGIVIEPTEGLAGILLYSIYLLIIQ